MWKNVTIHLDEHEVKLTKMFLPTSLYRKCNTNGGGERACKTLLGNHEKRPKPKQEDNIQIDIKEVLCESVDSTPLVSNAKMS
jgi:hypothetical protein